ncbi:MAG: hypothetical protein ACREBV_08815, partial [Candidatus Zixiibacteriota bacterium]
LILSVLIGFICAVGGYLGASVTNTSIAGFMAVTGGLVFAITITVKSIISMCKRTESVLSPNPKQASAVNS